MKKNSLNPTPAVAAGNLIMGTAGLPTGLDPANAAGARAWQPFGAGTVGYQPEAGPAGQGFTPEELVRRSNFWRDNYNPLRGLTIAWLMAQFEQAERGAFAEIQLILRKAEKRFPVIKGLIEKLLSSVEELDGKVRVKEQLPYGVTPAMAEAQRKFLQGRYDLLQNFRVSVAQLVLADLRGYAVLQKHRFADGPNAGAVQELYWLEPWCWSRDGFYGDLYYNENSYFGIGLGTCQSTLGEANRIGSANLPRTEFVIREVDSPSYEITLIAFVNWLMGRKDYAAFTEIFGLPNCLVIMPAAIPVGKEAEYQAAAERVARGTSGALPAGSDAKFPTAGVRAEAPFKEFCEAQLEDVVLAGTGGVLTMLSKPTGIGKGASAEHEAAWQKIAVNKARRVNEVLQRDFDLPELQAEFPGQPICVEFALDAKDQEDVGSFLDNAVKCVGLGYQVDMAEISDRSGIKLLKAPEPAPGSGALASADNPSPQDPLAGDAQKAAQSIDQKEIKQAVRNRLVKLLNRAGADNAEQVYAAIAAELKPLHDRLEAISKISDPAIRNKKLAAVYADMDQIIRDLQADPAQLVDAITALNTDALIEGLQGLPPIENSDRPGHEFHGNQWSSGAAADRASTKAYGTNKPEDHAAAAKLQRRAAAAAHAAGNEPKANYHDAQAKAHDKLASKS